MINELGQRKANGDTDLIIDYIHNIPKILNSTKTENLVNQWLKSPFITKTSTQ